ncbi:MAG: restriction endonuclease subunit S, partial [Clostridia bacterium]|nr:restriction endonuclease subunit S [Clostridia bacterium]
MRVKEFRCGDLISDIHKAQAINKDDLTVSDNDTNTIRYITRTGENNGCELLADRREVSEDFVERGNAITIGDTTATCFYQDEAFITGDHMVVVRADSWLNKNRALYVITLLNNEQYKYS